MMNRQACRAFLRSVDTLVAKILRKEPIWQARFDAFAACMQNFHDMGRQYGGAVDEIAKEIGWWCTRPDYLDAIAHREPRVDLNGMPVGESSEAEARFTAEKLYGPRAERVLARIAARQSPPSEDAPVKSTAADEVMVMAAAT